MKNRKRKYKIKFKKLSCWNSPKCRWEEVQDGYILNVLATLQQHYDFKVVSTIMHNSTSANNICCIVIKCSKKDKSDIFIEFCDKLSENITNVKF